MGHFFATKTRLELLQLVFFLYLSNTNLKISNVNRLKYLTAYRTFNPSLPPANKHHPCSSNGKLPMQFKGQLTHAQIRKDITNSHGISDWYTMATLMMVIYNLPNYNSSMDLVINLSTQMDNITLLVDEG